MMFTKLPLLVIFINVPVSFVKAKPFTSMSQDLEIISSCNISHPVTKLRLNRSLIEKRFDDDIPQDFKCFLHCLYAKYHWISESGIFDLACMKESLSESNLDPLTAKNLLTHCTALKVSDPCERSFQFTSCFWNTSKFLEQLELSTGEILFSSEYFDM